MKEQKVLFITGMTRPNPFHKAIADAIGADTFTSRLLGNMNFKTNPMNLIKSVLFLPKGYDIYLSETVFIIPVIAKILHIIPQNSKIINISADPILYNLVNGIPNGLPAPVFKYLLHKVDGFIMIGKWGFLLDKLGISSPRIEIAAAIDSTSYSKLIKIKKVNFNHKIIFVGNVIPSRMKYKGLDIIINALNIIRKEYPDSTLMLTGNSKLDRKYDGVVLTNYKSDISKIIGSASIAVNMGRGDTFPIGTLESMLAGVPTIVSTQTGTKSIVASVNKKFIADLDQNDLASKITYYFGLTKIKKIELSRKFKRAAIPYNTKNVLRNFKNKWAKLVDMTNKLSPAS